MKIAIIGYGKMGKSIEQFAPNYGFEVCAIIDPVFNNTISIKNLNNADVAIEFTTPTVAFDNVLALLNAGVNVVSGTTGWYEHLPTIEKLCIEKQLGFFYASNFSIGMNIVFKLTAQLSALLNKIDGYILSISETHHTQKLDKPSGTAITLASQIIANSDQYKTWQLDCDNTCSKTIPIHANRSGNVVGIHTVEAQSKQDSINLQHTAHNRDGFTIGALLACKFIVNKTGIYNMDNLISL